MGKYFRKPSVSILQARAVYFTIWIFYGSLSPAAYSGKPLIKGCYGFVDDCLLVFFSSTIFTVPMNNKTVVVISIYIVNKSKAVLQILLGSVIFIRLMPDHCLALSISKSSAIEA